MGKQKRIYTVIVFVISLVMTFISAFVLKMDFLVFIFVALQFCSYFWYSLSYIPFGQKLFTKFCKTCMDPEESV